ncbi:MAG: N-acetyltransferase family protein [Candidatus Aminicenantaceae bacterium]
MIIREANPEDNQALLDISRSEPMESAVLLYEDRSPDYFYLPRLQGDDSKVFIAERNKEVMGAISISFRKVRLFGTRQRIGYTGGLRIKESARGGWVLYRLMRKVVEEMLKMNVSICILTALKENQKILNVISGRLNIPRFHPIAQFRVFHIIPFMKYRCINHYQIERLSPSDLEEMVDLFRKQYSSYELVEEFNRERIERLIEQSKDFSLDNFLVAKLNGKIVSVLSYWDQSNFKKTIVQKYRGFFKGLYYVLKPMGILPSQGNPLKVLSVRHLVCEEGYIDAARELLKHTMMLFRPRFKLFQVGLHDKTHLIRALRRFPRIGLHVVLFAACKEENPTLIERLQKSLIWEDMTLH